MNNLKQDLASAIFGLIIVFSFIFILYKINPDYAFYIVLPKKSTEVEILDYNVSIYEGIDDGGYYFYSLYECNSVGILEDSFNGENFYFSLKEMPEKGECLKICIYEKDGEWITNPFGVENFYIIIALILVFPIVGIYIFFYHLFFIFKNLFFGNYD